MLEEHYGQNGQTHLDLDESFIKEKISRNQKFKLLKSTIPRWS